MTTADILHLASPLSITGLAMVLAGAVYAVRVLRHKTWQRSFGLASETRFRLPAAGTYHLSQNLWAGGAFVRARGAPFVRGGTRCRVVDERGRPVRLWSGLLPERLLHRLDRYQRGAWVENRDPRFEHLWSFRARRAGPHIVQFKDLPVDAEGCERMVIDRAIGFEAMAVVLTISIGLMLIVWQAAS